MIQPSCLKAIDRLRHYWQRGAALPTTSYRTIARSLRRSLAPIPSARSWVLNKRDVESSAKGESWERSQGRQTLFELQLPACLDVRWWAEGLKTFYQ
jgi:hypothetical protein